MEATFGWLRKVCFRLVVDYWWTNRWLNNVLLYYWGCPITCLYTITVVSWIDASHLPPSYCHDFQGDGIMCIFIDKVYDSNMWGPHLFIWCHYLCTLFMCVSTLWRYVWTTPLAIISQEYKSQPSQDPMFQPFPGVRVSSNATSWPDVKDDKVIF